MSKLFVFLASALMLGASHAAEIADAPIPEPNYAGIIAFLVLMIGGGIWFFLKIMSNDKKAKQEEKK